MGHGWHWHYNLTNHIWLVVSTPLKNISQNGNLPQIGVKIKNIWNHQLEIYNLTNQGFIHPTSSFFAFRKKNQPLGWISTMITAWLIGSPSKWHLWIYQKTRLWYLEKTPKFPCNLRCWSSGVKIPRCWVSIRRNQNSPSLKLTKTPKIYQDVWLVSEDANIYLFYLESWNKSPARRACENRLSGSHQKGKDFIFQ